MINAKRIHEILTDCMFNDNYTDDSKCIAVQGITSVFGFKPEKIDEHKNEIYSFLEELPVSFWESPIGDDGYSFLQMPFDKNDQHWGEQINAQELLVLGLATGYAQYLFSKPIWKALPGGVPYVVLHKEPVEVQILTVGDVKTKDVLSIKPVTV